MTHPFTQANSLSHKQRAWYGSIIKNLFALFLPACLFSSRAFAQTTTTFPPATSCTSKDLTLVSATLPGATTCNECVSGDSVHRTLNLAINNKTGSTRTSFAFWGTLVIRNSNGTVSSTRSIQGCGGPIAKNTTTTLPFNQIGYVCGQSLTIKDLFLAWTDASPNSTCPSLNSATINPKCGTLDSIRINTGLDGSFSVTNATCTTPGSIDLTPMGGKSPYTYSWVASDGGVVPSGQSTHQDLTGLVAGTYTVTITDDLNCTSTRFTAVTAAAPVTANAGDDFTKTCISNTSGKQIGTTAEDGFTYSWSPTTGLSDATASNPTANPSSTTTYTVTKTNTSSGCSNTDDVTVTVNTNAPDAPGFCAVQPSLCGPATGSITIKSPLGADYKYSIDNGANYQADPVFNDLAAGSVTGIKVQKLSSGCISSGVNCDASDCSSSGARLTTQNNTQTLPNSFRNLNIVEGQISLKALPNPFSDNVKFVLSAPQAGHGSLEIFNMLGQKVKTVFQGRILPGINTFQVILPAMKSAELIYVLRVGDKKVTGKLLQLNQ